MVYLTVSIIFMAGLAVVFRCASSRDLNPLGLNTVLRIAGGVAAGGFLIASGPSRYLPHVSDVAGLVVAGAVCYWLAGLAAIRAVAVGHLGATWMVTRCAMVVPTLASLIVWQEWPRSGPWALPVAGLAVTVLAIVLVGVDRVRRQAEDKEPAISGAWVGWLALAFVAQGSWEVTLRAAGGDVHEEARVLFILGAFMGAGVISVGSVMLYRPRLGRREWQWGILAATCGLVGSGLRPWAVRDLGGVIAFPATAVGVMVLVQVAAGVIWGQQLGRWGWAGFVAAGVGLVLLTLSRVG